MAKKRAVKKATKKEPVGEYKPNDPAAVVESVVSAFSVSGAKFPNLYKENGDFNPDYLTAAYACLVGSVTDAVMVGEKPPTSLNDAIKALQTIAAIHGFELERVTDKRTPEQIQFETVMMLVNAPETILEQTESMLEEAEKSALRAVSMTADYINDKVMVARNSADLEYMRNGPQPGTESTA